MNTEAPTPLATPGPWNHVSRGYENYIRNFLGKFSEAARSGLELAPEHHLLDVACGPGTTSLLFAPYVARIDAVDFAEEMLGIFRRHVSERRLTHVHLHQADGQALPFSDASFERAVSMFGLMFFPNRVAGLKEISRCLKPGGKVLVAGWAPVERSPLMQIMSEAVRAANPDMGSAKAAIDSWEDPELIRQEVGAAGFVDIRIKEQCCDYEFESGEALWDEMSEGGVPLTELRKSLGETAWSAFSKTTRTHLGHKLQGENARSSTAFLAYATKPRAQSGAKRDGGSRADPGASHGGTQGAEA